VDQGVIFVSKMH